MGQTVNEQLSALLDGELPIEQQDLLLRRLERDTGLRARFARFSMIGDVLSDPLLHPGALQIADRVRAELEEDAAPAPQTRASRSIGAGLLGAGLAAAAAVLVALNLNPVRDPVVSPQLAGVAPVSVVLSDPAPQRANVAPERMTRYLVSHAEYSNSATRQIVDSHIVMPAFQRAAWQTSGTH